MRSIATAALIFSATAALLLAVPEAQPVGAAVPGYNGKIAFTRSGDIWVMEPDGSHPTNITNSAAEDSLPAWSPDGSQITFQSVYGKIGKGIWIMNADGTARRQITFDVTDTGPAWSPDGSTIAFYARRQSQSGVYLVDVDSRDVALLIPLQTTTFDVRPAWSPDGSRIAYSDLAPGVKSFGLGGALYVANADGTDPVEIVPPTFDWKTGIAEPGKNDPSWSPDGSLIAYSSGGDIFLVNPDGRQRVNLTAGSCACGSPRWSPDGKRIVFAELPYYVAQVSVMAADGSGRTPLTTGYKHAASPDWQPLAQDPGTTPFPLATPTPGTLPGTGGSRDGAGQSLLLTVAAVEVFVVLVIVGVRRMASARNRG